MPGLSDPGIGTFDFDRQKPGINSQAATKSVPRGFLKVTLLEKGMKGAYHLTENFGNSERKVNGKVTFRKFQPKIEEYVLR